MTEENKETSSGMPATGEAGSPEARFPEAPASATPHSVPESAPLPPPPAASPGRPHTWRMLLFGLTIFLCGGVVGAGGALLAVHRIVARVMGQSPELSAERATWRLKRGLGLTDAQARQVQEIYQRRFATVRTDLRETRLRVGVEVGAMREEIAKILTEKQAAEFRRRADFLEGSLPVRGPGRLNGPGRPNGFGGLNGPSDGLGPRPGMTPGLRRGAGPNAPVPTPGQSPDLGPAGRPGPRPSPADRQGI